MQALEVYQSFLQCQLLLFHFVMRHPLSLTILNINHEASTSLLALTEESEHCSKYSQTLDSSTDSTSLQ